MFDIEADDILLLTDVALRELVAQLCEAELAARGLSPTAVTWSGHHAAGDGGIDVHVDLPAGTVISDALPRWVVGFQVKKSDMPESKIIAEMRPPPDPPVKVPKGAVAPPDKIRPAIEELAHAAGAYIIVSGAGSVTQSVLKTRRESIRKALNGVPDAHQLHTDFYDRGRLATWVRCHPGIVVWVRQKIGKSLIGWQPYGPWSGPPDTVDTKYLLDDIARLHVGSHPSVGPKAVLEGIVDMRRRLAQDGSIMRLVGLSGVGKTRLVQALFDKHIGTDALPEALAIYTNGAQDAHPAPLALASNLIASSQRAIIIVDHCSPELHGNLAQLCSAAGSKISVLTVEYDVRVDQPERTDVVRLAPASDELIALLVQRRYPDMSHIDVSSIAHAAGGNARIAIALSETVERDETISGLSNDALFQRLFRQRHEADAGLLRAAQACALVYVFDGAELEGRNAELPRLAALAGQTSTELYRHVSELMRRDLVRQRSTWRAILPHAVANRLAAHALADIPFAQIKRQLFATGAERLACSFCFRLSFLHDVPAAIAIGGDLLAPGGMLGAVTTFNDDQAGMFNDVAAVLPGAALAALERAAAGPLDTALHAWSRHVDTLRALAYDSTLFARSVELMIRVATGSADAFDARLTARTCLDLFTIRFSGTHATCSQRLQVIELLLTSDDTQRHALGLNCLQQMLRSTDAFPPWEETLLEQDFSFGSRSRNVGLPVAGAAAVNAWYGAVIDLVERLARGAPDLRAALCNVLAQHVDSLWPNHHDALQRIGRARAADGFWVEGWIACCQITHYGTPLLSTHAATILASLVSHLAPAGMTDRARAALHSFAGARLLSTAAGGKQARTLEEIRTTVRNLGAAMTADMQSLPMLMTNIAVEGHQAAAFGRGLASSSPDHHATWTALLDAVEQAPTNWRSIAVLQGFLDEIRDQDACLAQALLDAVDMDSSRHACLARLRLA